VEGPPRRPAASTGAAVTARSYPPARAGGAHYPPVGQRRDYDDARRYAGRVPATPTTRPVFGMPNLRRNVCPHFYMTGSRGAIPIHAPHLLKALSRQDVNVSRCQLRGGVHLEQGYVADVCLSARFNQCVFYEDELARR